MNATLEAALQVGRTTVAILLIPVACFAGFVFWAFGGPATEGYALEVGVPAMIYVALTAGCAAYGLWGARTRLAWALLILAAAPPLLLVVIMV